MIAHCGLRHFRGNIIANPTIFQQYLRAPKSVAEYGAEMDTREANQLELAAKRQAVADDTALRQAFQTSGGDSNALIKVLQQAGNYKGAQAVQDKLLAQQKTQADIEQSQASVRQSKVTSDKTEAETKYAAADRHARNIASIQTPQDILAYLDEGIATGVFSAPPGVDPAAHREAMLQRAAKFPTVEAFKQAAAQNAIPVLERFKTDAENSRAAATVATTRRGQDIGATTARRGQDITVRGQDLTDKRSREENALKAQEVASDRSSGLPVLGVPAPTVTPWGNQSNPKDANKVKAQEMARGSKEIEKDTDAARKEAATAAAAARFIELNKKTTTGGIVDKMGVTRWAQGMGAEYSEMEAITAKLVPGMREPGSGTTSDADLALFKSATLGVDKPRKANENIAKGLIVRAQQAQEYADFRQTYLEQNGTLQGADRHWKDYANKNPIFDPEKKDFELNPKRKPWGEHFKGQQGKTGKPPASSVAGGLTAAEQTELQELRKALGK